MDRLIHTSLTAMRGALSRQATTANNLANVNTAGFRGDMDAVRGIWLSGGPADSRVLASEGIVSANMSAGSVAETGRDLDVAMAGDALLAVQAEDGTEAYSRRGDLQVSDSGLLTLGDGTPVVGDGGPITLPGADKVQIDRDGSIYVLPQGSEPGTPLQLVDRLKVVSPQGSRIAKGLDGLFKVVGGGALPADPQARVMSGKLEGSNVNATQALVDMIDAARNWENQIKLLTTARELDSATTDLMRLPE